MMKKTYKSSLLALSVLASFTSCSESESLQQANLSKDKITFHATLDNSWKPMSPASSSRAAIAAATEKGPIVVPTPFGKPLYLHPVVQDGIHIWSKEGKTITRSGAPLEDVEHERVAQTRGTMSTKTDLSDYNSFGVTAIYKEGDTYQSLFANAEATKSAVDGFWGIEDKDKAQWPIDGIVSFHAYAPFYTKSSNMLTLTADPEKVQSKITYTASADDIINQPDLIVATSTGSRNNPGQDDAVNLQFSHALTAVSFAISKDLVEVIGAGNQLVSLSLEGVYTQGDCELAAKDAEHSTALLKWTGSSDKTGKYEFDLTDKNIIIDENLKDMALTEDNQTLMMIPQTLTADAKLKFEFKLNGVPQFLSISMDKQEWLPGTSVIYKLSASAINSLTNTEVVYPSTWNAVGYPKQAFVKDEAIGLFAVSLDKRITAKNVKLVKQVEDGNEIWKTSDGNKFLRTANYKYFAYYPYDANLSETDLDVNAETADAFFTKKITNWNPAINQNTEKILQDQDLQVASGVVKADASTLTFEMAHSMGLAVMNLKDKKVVERRTFRTTDFTYYFPELPENLRAISAPDKSLYTDSEKEPSQTVHASTNFEGHSPYKSKENLYMQIIKPSENVVFVAAEETGKPRSGWGALYPERSTFYVAKNVAVSKDIYSDADFYYLACHLTAKDKYEDNKVQKFVATAKGTYKLQCWGASGRGLQNNDWGGRGGYAEGDCTLDMSKTLYVCVGGKGNQYNNPVYCYGTINFGQYGNAYGGGATSITTTLRYDAVRGGLKNETEKGQLAEYVNHKDEVLLVAGGGGGAEWSGQYGGAGGGDNGGTPQAQTYNIYNGSQCSSYGTGATQDVGGYAVGGNYWVRTEYKSGFGYGGAAADRVGDFGANGGGGWYGGGGSTGAGVAGGGSSYGKTSSSPYSSTAPILTNYKTICGWSNFSPYNESENKIPVPGGKSNEFEQKGHEGHGACVITQTSFN